MTTNVFVTPNGHWCLIPQIPGNEGSKEMWGHEPIFTFTSDYGDDQELVNAIIKVASHLQSTSGSRRIAYDNILVGMLSDAFYQGVAFQVGREKERKKKAPHKK